MGLGVFLCRAVFESLGGHLTFTSTLGQGTRATVTLPVDGALSIYPPTLTRTSHAPHAQVSA
jgi:K+-sensing histidine kinase KdpD